LYSRHHRRRRNIEIELLRLRRSDDRKIEGAGAAITYITDAWGTRVELLQLGL
jgi:hypothetical protein